MNTDKNFQAFQDIDGIVTKVRLGNGALLCDVFEDPESDSVELVIVSPYETVYNPCIIISFKNMRNVLEMRKLLDKAELLFNEKAKLEIEQSFKQKEV